MVTTTTSPSRASLPPRYMPPEPDPETKEPPWTHTMTGRWPPSTPGVQMLRLRQSSEPASGSPPMNASISIRAGRAPAPPARGRRGVGNAGERPRPVALDPANPATPHLDHTVHHCDLQLDREPADTSGNLATRPTAPSAHERDRPDGDHGTNPNQQQQLPPVAL